MPNTEQDAVVTSQQAAEQLGVSVTTITRLVNRGLLRAYKLTPGKTSPLRIYQSSITRYLKTRQQPE